MPDVLRHHAGCGHGLVEARPAPGPRCHAHAQLVVPGLPVGGGCVCCVLITLPGADTGTPGPPRPLSAPWPPPLTSVLVSPVLHTGAELTTGDPRGRGLVTSQPGLVSTLDNEAGTRGRESGLDTLPVLQRRTEVTLPHTLDTVLDIRKLTYLRLCKKKPALEMLILDLW